MTGLELAGVLLLACGPAVIGLLVFAINRQRQRRQPERVADAFHRCFPDSPPPPLPSKLVALRPFPDPYPSFGGAGPFGVTVERDRARHEARLVLAPSITAKAVITAALVILLTGCLPAKPIPAGAEPVDAQCDSQCYQPCDTAIPPWTPADPDAPEAWDDLIEDTVIPAGELAQRCEAHRAACTRCLDRLRRAGVIR